MHRGQSVGLLRGAGGTRHPRWRSKGGEGARRVPLVDFHVLPRDEPWRETVLEPGDLVTAVVLPAEASGFAAHARYIKVRDRTSYAFAIVSVAAMLRIEADRVADARVALGGVAMKPWRSREARGRAGGPTADTSDVPAGRRCRNGGCQSPRATTATRSSSRGGPPSGPLHWRSPARHPACPPFRHHRSPPVWKSSLMLDPGYVQDPGTALASANLSRRREGLLKVTGCARFAADNHPEGMLHARPVHKWNRARTRRPSRRSRSQGSSGRGGRHDAGQRPEARGPTRTAKITSYTFRMDLLQNDRVRYANQPIAGGDCRDAGICHRGRRVVGSAVRGRAGARRGSTATRTSCRRPWGEGEPADADNGGDVEADLGGSAKRVSTTYETPAQYHNALEPHAVVAQWDGDKLSVDMPSQAMSMGQARIGQIFGIDPSHVLIRSPFLGGGFGSKAFVKGPQILGIMAAKMTGRPVKLVLRRDQMFGPVGHRAPTRQTLRIGANVRGSDPGDTSPQPNRHVELRRVLRSVRYRDSHAVRGAVSQDDARGSEARHRYAPVHAGAGRGLRLDRP